MAVATLEPAGEGTLQNGTYSGGSGDYTNLQLPDDDATSFVNVTRGGGEHSVYVDALEAAQIDADPTVRFRGRKNTSGFVADWEVGFRISGSNSLDDRGAAEPADLTWFTDTTLALARPGGGSWEPSDFAGAVAGAVEIMMRAGTGANTGTNHNYSTVTTDVEFTPSGGFALFVAQWLPPLIAAASHGLLRREVVAILSSLKVRPSADWEFRKLMESYRRRPAYVF